ncbi:hypothetical protein PHJA_001337800 [Phtheirospermum japonicum]|uniref:Uncharacterized protein n=1 Tax=Phtheirospermum japonicum TaxID=374723 RepID=A0A830BVF8_9LAMI|nr:hypothetical protein PHJA_001337800 [Phtheirospermum japonicum]
MKWELVEDIGDKVLYLSPGSSFGDTARTKSTANTIRFPKFRGDVAVFYSLRDRKYHSLDGEYEADNAYGLKILDFASWIMPKPFTPEDTPDLTWN